MPVAREISPRELPNTGSFLKLVCSAICRLLQYHFNIDSLASQPLIYGGLTGWNLVWYNSVMDLNQTNKALADLRDETKHLHELLISPDSSNPKWLNLLSLRMVLVRKLIEKLTGT